MCVCRWTVRDESDVSKLQNDMCFVRMICGVMDWRSKRMNYLNLYDWGIAETCWWFRCCQPTWS